MAQSHDTFLKAARRVTIACGSLATVLLLSAVFSSSNATRLQAADDAGTGSFTGVITFDGTPPALADLVKKGDASVKDPTVCAAESIPNESLVVGKSGGIAHVFIYLSKAPDGVKVPSAPSTPVVFDQKGCRFLPHSLLMRTKQTVLVKSDDPIAHNTHTFPLRNTGFNTAIKAMDRVGVPLVYDKPEKLPIEVKCDFHTWMKAYHLPLDHPFVATTDEDGKFEIKGLPPGKHKFIVWQEKAGYLNRAFEVDIKAGKSTDTKMKFPAAKFTAFDGPRPKTVIISSVR